MVGSDQSTSVIILSFSRRVIPVVMGARLEEYEAVAPYNSFIHVDQFKGPRELAEYLDQLDQDDDLYNEYFQGNCRFCSSESSIFVVFSGKGLES